MLHNHTSSWSNHIAVITSCSMSLLSWICLSWRMFALRTCSSRFWINISQPEHLTSNNVQRVSHCHLLSQLTAASKKLSSIEDRGPSHWPRFNLWPWLLKFDIDLWSWPSIPGKLWPWPIHMQKGQGHSIQKLEWKQTNRYMEVIALSPMLMWSEIIMPNSHRHC